MKTIFTLILLVVLGLAYSPLQAQEYEIGTGTNVNSSTSYPSPYGNYYYGSKEQYIIRASELWAAGASNGNISSLAFNVATPSGVSLANYTISIGTTSDSVLSGTFLGNLTQVYTNTSYTDVTGWNTHTFSSPFAWDGVSNIVIETCFNNSSYVANGQVYYTTTNYSSTINYHADQSGVCSTTSGSAYSQRPNMKLGISNPNPNDLAIEDVISPNIYSSNNPSSTTPVQIKIKNQGTAAQNGFTVGYTIDGRNTFVTETINDTLFPGGSLNYTFSTPANLGTNGSYPCAFFVSNSGDQNIYNDTMFAFVLVCQTFSGNLTVGGTGADFNTLSEALNALSSCGVTGPVTLQINSGTYDEFVMINPIPGASATNTITITSATGNANDVHFSTTSNSPNSAMFYFNQADYITISNISVEYNATSYMNLFYLINESDHNKFINNDLYIHPNGGGSGFEIEACDDIYIKGNTIHNGSQGIKITGASSNDLNNDIVIDSNQMFDYYDYGIYMYYTKNAEVHNNYLECFQSNNYMYSVYSYYAHGTQFTRNKIRSKSTSSQYGIYLYRANYGVSSDTSFHRTLVANNMIDIEIVSSSTSYGLYNYYCNDAHIINNSIRITGNGSSSSRAFYQYNSGYPSYGEYIYNNIFSNFSGGYAAYFNTSSTIYGMDYNNYYVPDGSSYFLYYSGNKSTLSAMQTASGKDANSVSINPSFVSSSDLHVTSLGMSDKGTPYSGVSIDIDYETRNTSTPDIGADEYTPPQNNITIINMYAMGIDDEPLCDLSANEQFVIQFVNNGAATQTSIPVGFKLDAYSAASETWTGSLVTGDTATHTFTTPLNMSQAGLHQLSAYTALSNDENKADDTLSAKFNTFTAVSIPHFDDFESRTNYYYHLNSQDEATVVIDTIHGISSESAIYFEGGDYYNNWNYSGSDIQQHLMYNQDHMASVNLCPIDASGLTSLRMSFNYEQNSSDANGGSCIFFIRVNDSLFAKSLGGDSVWTGSSWTTLTIDLSPYCGGDIALELVGFLRTNYEYYGSTGNVDDITIDNFRLYVPKNNDVAPVNIVGSNQSDCGSATDSLYIRIKNLGLLPQNNIPVFCDMDWGPNNYSFSQTYSDTLQPEEEDWVFMGTINTSINGQIDVLYYTALSTDEDKTNDTSRIQGYQEVYKTIPFVADFETEDYDWMMNNFWRQDLMYFGGSGHALLLEKYGGVEPKYEQPLSNLSNNTDGYAVYDERIGVITANTYLKFDYNFLQISGGFSDSVNFALSTNCTSEDYQNVASINPGSPQSQNVWQTVFAPVGHLAGNTAQLAIYYLENNYSQGGFMLAIDNVSLINSTPVDLGNDTSLCGGSTLVLNTQLSAQDFQFSWHGPGVDTSATGPTLSVSIPGTYWVEVEDSMGMISTDAIQVSFYPQVGGHLSVVDSALCFGDSTEIIVNLTGTFPIVFDWTDGTSTYSDTTDTYVSSKWFSPTTSTSYTLLSAVDSNGCSATINHQKSLVVHALPTVSASGLLGSYCISDAADTLSATPSGGNFNGLGMSGNQFNPSTAGAGNHSIIYTYTDMNSCKNSDTLITIVHSNPVVNIVSPVSSTYCDNSASEIVYAYPAGGTFSGAGMTSNVLNPAFANPGLNTITYSFTDGNMCSSSDSVSFTLNTAPTVSITTSLDANYCSNAASVNLTATPSGGSFVGKGVSGNSFEPSLAGSGPATIIYSYTDGNTCSGSDTITTNVYAAPTVSITSSVQSAYCSNDASVALFAYPQGGTFTGSGVSGQILNPATAVSGLNTITYTYTDGNSCTAKDSVSYTLHTAPSVSISTSLNASYCSSDNSVSLTATPSGGSFTGNGVSANTFDPAQAANGAVEILYNYTDGNGCSGMDTISTQVFALPTVLITSNLANQYCKDGSSMNLSAYPSGGSFTGNGVHGNMFYTDSASTGNQSIVYSYTDGNACTNTDTVEFMLSALPTVSFASPSDVCANVSQLGLSGATPLGGTYSGTAVNSINGVFYPVSAGVGLSSIVYSYTDANGCSNTDTAEIRVVGIPENTFSLPANVCKSDTISLNYTGNASASANYNWNFNSAVINSGSGVGPYSLRWDTAGIKVVSLSVSDSGCVSQTNNQYTNVLDAIASISTVGGASACYLDSVLLFANNGPGYSFQWFDTSGTMTSTADTLPFHYALASGSYYAEVTNNFGCKAMSNVIDATIYPQILADFTLPSTACKDDLTAITLNGTSDTISTYMWDFNGGTVASGSGAGPYSVMWNMDGQKEVKLQIEKWGCYSDITSKFIDIVTTPATITALGPTTFCDGDDVTLYPNSGANLAYEWFKDAVSLSNTNAFYTASASGQYTVKVTNTVLGCTNTSSPVNVVVNTTNFNLAFTANQTTFSIPPFNVSINNQTPDTNSYYWNWSLGDGTSSTVANPQHQYAYDGTYTVGVIAQSINTGCFDTLVKNDYIVCNGGSANPCTLAASISPSGPMSICPGDSVLLTAASNPAGTLYQWLKDGVLITGADSNSLWATTSGNYQIMVTDTVCSKFSNPFSLSVYNTITPVIAANGSIMPCTNDSMELYVTSTFNSYLWSNNATGANIYVKSSGDYTVQATDINGCKTTSAPYVVNASLLQKPEICIVGIDSATNSNFVVWERSGDPLIDSFRVYRESTVAGVYNLIGSRSVNDPGIFHDVNSNPKVQAYRYKLTAVDTCGMETPPSNFHKTLHLSINAGLNGSWNLIWSHYEGFNFGTYRIYRGYDSTALQPLTQIQSNLNSYTDLNPPSGTVYYQIEVISPHPCYPDSIYSKAQTNYNTSRSNRVNTTMAPNTGMHEQMIADFAVSLFPNPSDGQFTFELMNESKDLYQISVHNLLGQELYMESDIQVTKYYKRTINLNQLAPGVYYFVVKNKESKLVKKIVIN